MVSKNKKTKTKSFSRPRKKLSRKRQAVSQQNSIQSSYILNDNFEFFYELRDLILKSSPAELGEMTRRMNNLGHIKLAIISGIFMNKENPDPMVVDLLMVGDDIEPRKLKTFLKSLEAEVGKEIKFALLEKEEFKYRYAMFDRFIRALLEGPHDKLINKLGI